MYFSLVLEYYCSVECNTSVSEYSFHGLELEMFELFFAAALMDTVIAPVDYGTVHVHEWGAVTFTEENVIFGANPYTDPASDFIYPQQWDEPVARAPIVYFYGEAFSGVFTVDVHSGSFIEALPAPANLYSTSSGPVQQSYRATWMLSGNAAALPEDLEGIAYSCISDEILDSWRTPPSYLLEFADGTREKFIYYECAISPSSDNAFYPVLLKEDGAVLDSDYRGPVMLFSKDGDTVTMELISDWPISGIALGSADELPDIPAILCDWAGGSMKSDELISMWDTWKDWIFDGEWSGDELLVFPLPANTVEGITSIELMTDQSLEVEYSRFYLGIISN
jgi:hypothetical protein